MHFSRSLEEMRSFYAERARRLVDLLLSRFDIHNVVTVLRAQAGTKRPAGDALNALVPVGWLVEPVAGETLRQNELAGAVDLLARRMPDREQADALRRASAEYERTEDLAALERTVVTDHALRTTAALAAAGPDARTLLAVVRREIDEHNLLVALRLRMRWRPAPRPSRRRRRRGSRGIDPDRRVRGGCARRRRLRSSGISGDSATERGCAPLRRWAASGDLPAWSASSSDAASRMRPPCSSPVIRWPSTCRSRSRPRSRPRRGICASWARRAPAVSTREIVRRELLWPEARA